MHLMRRGRRRIDASSRLVEANQEAERKCRRGQNQNKDERNLKLPARSLRIIRPYKSRIRGMIEMIGNRHRKLPRSTLPRDDFDGSPTHRSLHWTKPNATRP